VSDSSLIANIHALSHEGRGIATVNGKTVFIEGALPTETVGFQYLRHRNRFAEGKITDILTPAASRVVPRCRHFTECGGCSLQHLGSLAQVQFKEQVVLEQLQHFGRVEPRVILPPLMGPTYGYRRKARLRVKYMPKKGKLIMGFHEKDPRAIADCLGCETLHPLIAKRWREIYQLIAGLEANRNIPQIEVAVGDAMAALVFRHLVPLSERDQRTLVEFGQFHQMAIYLQPNGLDSIQKLWPTERDHYLSYHLPDYHLEIQFLPTDFIQVNSEMNHHLIARVIELLALETSDKMLDLFCGLGNFTLPLARLGASVVGVEGSRAAVTRAKINAEHNGLGSVEFFASDLQKPDEDSSWIKRSYDKVVLDPPRAGAPEIIPFLARSTVNRVVYVSCQPATLARDIGEWVNRYGFRLESIGVLDMFPQTTHIESIALLTR